MLKRVAILLLLTACGSDVVSPAKSLHLELAVPVSVVHPGDRVPVSLHVNNIGRSAVSLQVGPCSAVLEVSRANQVVASGLTPVCSLIAVEPKSLAPGESHSHQLVLEWPTRESATPALAAPGDYEVRGIVFSGGDRIPTPVRTVTLVVP